MKRAMLSPASAAAFSIFRFSSSLRVITSRLLSPVRGLRARFLPRDVLCEMRFRVDITFSCNMREPVILCQPQSRGIYKDSFEHDVRTERRRESTTSQCVSDATFFLATSRMPVASTAAASSIGQEPDAGQNGRIRLRSSASYALQTEFSWYPADPLQR
jgi:hypothetical protein